MLRYYLIILMALFLSKLAGQTQTNTLFNGYGIIGFMDSTTVNGGEYNILMQFNDDRGLYSAQDVIIGDNIWDIKCDRYRITHITATSPFLSVEVIKLNNNGNPPEVGGGNALIYRPTVNYQYVPSLVKLNDNLKNCISDNFRILLDEDILEASQSGSGGSNNLTDSFDFDRPILRVPEVGDVIGGQTYADFFQWQYFTEPNAILNNITSVYPVGTTNTITLAGLINNPGNATITNVSLVRTSPNPDTEIINFGTNTNYTTDISFTPQDGGSGNFNELNYSFRVEVDWTSGSEFGTVTSQTRSIEGVYPVLYGMSATDFSVSGDIYSALNKLNEVEGDKSFVLNGSGFIYIAIPNVWNDTDLTSINEVGSLNIISAFTVFNRSISSTGLDNDFTIPYTIYKLNNLTTINNSTYETIQ